MVYDVGFIVRNGSVGIAVVDSITWVSNLPYCLDLFLLILVRAHSSVL